MDARTSEATGRTWIAALVAAATLIALVGAPAAGGQAEPVLWSGATPDDRSGFAVGVGRELRIPLEAVGSFGSSVRIGVRNRPRGASLRSISEAPARAVFTWRPTAAQLGDRKVIFTATDGASAAPRLTVYIHVGRGAVGSDFRLSSVNGRSWNATLLRPIVARARPSNASRGVVRLRTRTPEHVPHILYLVAGRIDPSTGRYWLRVQLPVLPNNSTGWIPREAVGSFRSVDTHLVIERSRFRATLYRRGRPVFRSIVGVGEPRWPTPAGRFYVRERLTGFTDPIYGAIAFGTNGRSAILTDWPGGGFIGIHGTNQPQILPGRVSHGCVRLPNPSIRRLDRLMRIGTPVTIK
jgi:lipoprotein-anchoring transpeptidase ErfK/SrfK